MVAVDADDDTASTYTERLADDDGAKGALDTDDDTKAVDGADTSAAFDKLRAMSSLVLKLPNDVPISARAELLDLIHGAADNLAGV